MTILIPSYEPDERLSALIESIKALCGFKIVIVDDGSGDDYRYIFKAAEDAGCCVLTHEVNRGKGSALKTGFQYIKAAGEAEGVICADSDGQHRPEDIIHIAQNIQLFQKNIILGCRRFTGKVPPRSRFGNTFTRAIFYLTSGTRIYDTQTGLRGCSSDMLNWLCQIPGERFEYEMNMLLFAVKEGYIIHEVDIETVYIDENKSSHFRTIADSVRVYQPLLKFSASSILSAMIDFTLLFALNYFTENLLFSAVGARICSSIINYSVNKSFVFQAGEGSIVKKSLLRYFLLVGIVLILNYLMLSALNLYLQIPLFWAKLTTETTIFLLSYWSQRKFVFHPSAHP